MENNLENKTDTLNQNNEQATSLNLEASLENKNIDLKSDIKQDSTVNLNQNKTDNKQEQTIEIKDVEMPKVPTKILTKMHFAHIGKILFSLSVALLIICFISFLAPILYGIVMMVIFFGLIISAVFSLGLLLANDFYRSLWSFEFMDMTVLMNIVAFTSNFIYVCTFTSLIAAILMLIDNKKSVPRIVISFIMFVISALISIVLIMGA